MAHLGWSPAKPTPLWGLSMSRRHGYRRLSPQPGGCLRLLSTGLWCPSVCPQGDVYRATTQRLVDGVVSGYNATVFAYGPSGTGRVWRGGGGAGSLAAQASARCGCGRCALGPGSWHSSLGGRGRSLSQTGRGAQRGTVAAPSTQPSPCSSAPGSAWSAPAPPVQMGKLRP